MNVKAGDMAIVCRLGDVDAMNNGAIVDVIALRICHCETCKSEPMWLCETKGRKLIAGIGSLPIAIEVTHALIPDYNLMPISGLDLGDDQALDAPIEARDDALVSSPA